MNRFDWFRSKSARRVLHTDPSMSKENAPAAVEYDADSQMQREHRVRQERIKHFIKALHVRSIAPVARIITNYYAPVNYEYREGEFCYAVLSGIESSLLHLLRVRQASFDWRVSCVVLVTSKVATESPTFVRYA